MGLTVLSMLCLLHLVAAVQHPSFLNRSSGFEIELAMNVEVECSKSLRKEDSSAFLVTRSMLLTFFFFHSSSLSYESRVEVHNINHELLEDCEDLGHAIGFILLHEVWEGIKGDMLHGFSNCILIYVTLQLTVLA